ncbi:serine hydrolase domain-containing protein [Streptomyces sp. NPDC094458]|uniref:serine hydrolase domain-containing protein n=1 Tax=Streptomyces sp. NPDC094458 TaxID=3155208 RepID=UPI00333446BD
MCTAQDPLRSDAARRLRAGAGSKAIAATGRSRTGPAACTGAVPDAPRRRAPHVVHACHRSHTSGLPRLPPGLLGRAVRGGWFSNPYAGFSEDDLLVSLRRTRLRNRPGTRVLYSNFGGGLLGHVLARAAGGTGSDYPALLAERVTGPLGLTDTDCDPNRPQATGHWHDRPRPALLMPGLTAAGAVRSSARDLLRVLTALLGPETAPGPALRTALTEVQRPRLSVPRTGSRLCLIWNLRPRPGGALLHHSGGTRGFTAFAGFLPGSGTGLVALTNTAPTPLAPFVQSAYGPLRELDATPSATVWTARV